MDLIFNPAPTIESNLREIAAQTEGFGANFVAGVRPADPKFGDFQANGVLGHAKRTGNNPRELAQRLLDAALDSGRFDPEMVELSLAGPGFINFKCSQFFFYVII